MSRRDGDKKKREREAREENGLMLTCIQEYILP